ncbi:stage II sporulation protein D [Gracilibacillus sp. YIM 98692]|uniref:stage II sporulation protein D n=1 Tax=Gracilibacillus sp. YIM 98692 TaxID=2663532 RepID=UPI0013D20A01|nr:stage II sporulation protein D [Gracilibacillus sp. YIM 98692]
MAGWKKQNTKLKWKLATIMVITSLLTIMFIVPSIIVLPFNGPSDESQASIESIPASSQETTEIELESPFHVNVLRTQQNLVEEIPLENYVVHVVASEMPADFELEALKAQALAARTYIVRFLMHGGTEDLPGGADVTDTVQHQVYKNNDELREVWGTDYHWKIDKVKEAVAATQGEIITHNNDPITPAFFSTSNGYTENSEDYWENELPYLRTVASPWDVEISPKYLDQRVFTKAQVEEQLGVSISGQQQNFEITRTESNRVAEIEFGNTTLSGREVREKLNLASNDFTIAKKNNHYVFTTKGYGHGVGMSQYGANGMAQEGKNYADIIKYYYQGTNIQALEQAAPTLVAKLN